MILLDTNICIYIINHRPPNVVERFRRYRAGEIGLSSVVAAELAYGVAKSGSARNRAALEMFLAPFLWKYFLSIKMPFGFMVNCVPNWSDWVNP